VTIDYDDDPFVSDSRLRYEQQPVGEYPEVPVAAAAFNALDDLCQELEGFKAGNAQLLEENAGLRVQHRADAAALLRLTAERDIARAERDTARASTNWTAP
jgi:hypothetical protein